MDSLITLSCTMFASGCNSEPPISQSGFAIGPRPLSASQEESPADPLAPGHRQFCTRMTLESTSHNCSSYAAPLITYNMPLQGGRPLWSDQKDRRNLTSVAAAAATAILGVSISLPCGMSSAIAETASPLPVSLVQYSNLAVDFPLSPDEVSVVNTGLQEDWRVPRRGEDVSAAIDMHVQEGYTPDLYSMERNSGIISSPGQITAPPSRIGEQTGPRTQINGSTSLSSKPTAAVLLSANCPSSDQLVAAAAVGSVVSIAGNAMTQSTVSVQSVVGVAGHAAAVTQSSVSMQHVAGAPLLARALHHLGGGGLAGAVGASVVYPLDTIKTRMQAKSCDGKENKCISVVDCLKQLLDEEGPGSLYSGFVPQLLGIAPEKALKLTTNEIILQMLEQQLPGARLWILEIIAGGGGGLSQVLVTNPMEIVKLRLQIQSKLGSPKGLWQVVKELGIRGLYSGSGITLARDVPSSGIFFACYALLTQMYPEHKNWAGFLAAIPATVLVTPLDVIKTRLQMETAPGEEAYEGAWHCFRALLDEEGVKGLFRGGLMRVLRTSPQFGITLLVYSFFCDSC